VVDPVVDRIKTEESNAFVWLWEGTKQSCKGKNFVHACAAQPAAIMRHAVDAQHYSLYNSAAASQNSQVSQSVDKAESVALLAVCAE
jgi:hypothetical protein